MENKSRKNLKELGASLKEKAGKMVDGKSNLEEVIEFYEDARDLYERAVILRAKAYTGKEIEAVAEKISAEVKTEHAEITQEKPSPKPEKSSSTEEDMPLFDFSAMSQNEKPKESAKPNPAKIKEEQKPEQTKEINTTSPEEVLASINDHFKNAEDSSLFASMKKTPITNLKTAIGINDKFGFIKDLFEGEDTLYDGAVEKLNNMSDADEAKNYLSDLAIKHDWDLESKTVVTFVELIERRYAQD